MQTVPPLEGLMRGERSGQKDAKQFFFSLSLILFLLVLHKNLSLDPSFDASVVGFMTGAVKRLCNMSVCCLYHVPTLLSCNMRTMKINTQMMISMKMIFIATSSNYVNS